MAKRVLKPRKAAKPRPQKTATDYLIAAERQALTRYGVTVSDVGIQFSQDLDEAGFRNVWRLVSAIARRRSKAEASPAFLIGDWANRVEKDLGRKASYRIIEEEEEAYRFGQQLLHLAGATLMSLQLADTPWGSLVDFSSQSRRGDDSGHV